MKELKNEFTTNDMCSFYTSLASPPHKFQISIKQTVYSSKGLERFISEDEEQVNQDNPLYSSIIFYF